MCTNKTREYTRGIGIYPGDVKEDFSPEMFIDKSSYRNLAFHRPAYHSSSYDYNLTAQLVTDGVKDLKLPNWVSTSTSQHGTLKKNEREWLIDHNFMTMVNLKSATQVEQKGNRWYLTTQLTNPSEHPALMVRLKVVRKKSGDRILPVLYSDNYISLMPGEQRTIRIELEHADTRGEKPHVVVNGFNTGKVLE